VSKFRVYSATSYFIYMYMLPEFVKHRKKHRNMCRVSEFRDYIHVYWHVNCVIMGWLRLVWSIKLEVCFAKESYKGDYILQKRPVILSSLLTVATPYIHVYWHVRSVFCILTCIWTCQIGIPTRIYICVSEQIWHMYSDVHTWTLTCDSCRHESNRSY